MSHIACFCMSWDCPKEKDEEKKMKYCRKCKLSQPVTADNHCAVCGAEITNSERLVTLCGQKAMPFNIITDICRFRGRMDAGEMNYYCDYPNRPSKKDYFCWADCPEGCPIWADLDDAQAMECRD